MGQKMLLGLLLLLLFNNSLAVAQENLQQKKDEAVLLARAGNYNKALNELATLRAQGYDCENDEIVILNWAQRYSEAIKLYEKRQQDIRPDYVLLSVAGSYYALEQYTTAANLYKAVAANGDKMAQLWELQSLAKLNNKDLAEKKYQQLLSLEPTNISLQLSFGEFKLEQGQYREALTIFKNLLNNPAVNSSDLRHKIGVCYIKSGEFQLGALALKELLKQENDDAKFTKADYILALRLNGDYQLAINESLRLFDNYQKMPDYAIQAVGDAYLYTKNYDKAIELYQYLLQSLNSNKFLVKHLKAALAYAHILKGNNNLAQKYYHELLTEYPEYADFVMRDIDNLLSIGRTKAADDVYKVVRMLLDQDIYCQEYANLLEKNEKHIRAISVYKELADDNYAAQKSLAEDALLLKDYSLARNSINKFKEDTDTKSMVSTTEQKFIERERGTVIVGYSYDSDYKGNNHNSYTVGGQSLVTDNVSLTYAREENVVKNNELRTNYKTDKVGFILQNYNNNFFGEIEQYHNDIDDNGYNVGFTHYFDDDENLSVAISEKPLNEAGAIAENILNKSENISYKKILGKKDTYNLDMVVSHLSDGNKMVGYSGQWQHRYYDENNFIKEWWLYFNNSSYDKQVINGEDTAYESPEKRESYGVALYRYQGLENSYWENNLRLGWERDKPEKYSFGTSLELRAGKKIGYNQWLNIGVEYGVRTDENKSGLNFSYRNYDISYQIRW